MDLNKTIEIDVNVKLTGELPPLFPNFLIGTKIGNWIMFRDPNQDSMVNITLSVTSPDWCTAELQNETIKIDLFSNSEKTTKLQVTITETAPALIEGEIEITAKFSPPDNWMFNPSEDSVNFSIIPRYVGSLDATIEPLEGLDEFIVPPDENTTLPLNITNNYNGETKVTINFEESGAEKKWNISLDQAEIIIPKGETKTVYITIRPPSIDKLQRINGTITLTPETTIDIDVAEEYLSGESFEILTGPIVKEEEDEFEVDTNLLILLVVVIVILIIIGLIIRRKRA
jgi:hypothetical protein